VGPAGAFNYLPWEQYDVQGARLSTRQEIDWPIELGVVKVVPYVLGDATYWGEDQAGQQLTRLFWEAGVRASMPMYSVDPTANSDLFNVHGLAHKVVFEAELSYAQSNKNLEELPLYDPLDDNSVEAWRRIFMTNTFGVPSMTTVPPGTPPGKILIPPQFDERLYALRTGLQDWVTSPSTEIAGDMAAVRLGVDQRWQTKRGRNDCQHIIDWMSLDTNVTFYPDPDRDNFGKPLGLLDYNYAWHVGDQLTLTSDGIFDFFDQGQKIVTVGAFLNRPPRGSLYMGFRLLEGPIDSKIISLTYSYWMSPKWVSSFGTTIDVGSQGNVGENFTITRVGESLLISAGFNVDPARNSVGAALVIEPRFWPKARLGNINGAQIPPAGAFGLE
ncbi:MAG: organic solvent tolerance protein OstA, partial [Phycisphaerales bacterium]